MTLSQSQIPQRVAISLSREEVFYVARLLRLPNIPGVDTGWLTEMEASGAGSDLVRLLAAVGLALVARGYLAILPPQGDQTRVELHPTVATLLQGCVTSQEALFISTVTTTTPPFAANLHWTGTLGIAHTTPQPGVHLFEAIETREKIIAAALDTLHVAAQPTVSAAPAEHIQATALLAAREPALRHDIAATTAALTQGGLSATLAQSLGATMANPATVFASVLSWHRSGVDQASIKFMSVIAAPQACFIATAQSAVPETVSVRAASGTEVRQWLLTPPVVTG
jgi:hypothetical protein